MESTPNSQTPLVSVLCVSRNQDHNLRRCLVALSRSTLAAQTQVVVVDLASHDETATVVADFSELTALRLPKNFGWTKAANIGLRSTTAENILFLDPCVELDPGTVEVLLSSVAESGTVAAAVATLRTTDGSPASYLRPLPVATLLRMEAHAPAQPEESFCAYPVLAACSTRSRTSAFLLPCSPPTGTRGRLCISRSITDCRSAVLWARS